MFCCVLLYFVVFCCILLCFVAAVLKCPNCRDHLCVRERRERRRGRGRGKETKGKKCWRSRENSKTNIELKSNNNSRQQQQTTTADNNRQTKHTCQCAPVFVPSFQLFHIFVDYPDKIQRSTLESYKSSKELQNRQQVQSKFRARVRCFVVSRVRQIHCPLMTFIFGSYVIVTQLILIRSQIKYCIVSTVFSSPFFLLTTNMRLFDRTITMGPTFHPHPIWCLRPNSFLSSLGSHKFFIEGISIKIITKLTTRGSNLAKKI